MTSFTFSFFDGSKKIKAQEDALETARKKLLELAGKTCIHDLPNKGYGRCDDCPISFRNLGSHEASRLICTRYKEYSK